MRRDTPAVALAGLLFFLSGAAALVYQVAWQRLLALHSGVGLYSVAMIVAAFMAGLGIGSHQGGRLSTAVSSRRALRAFAALELGDRRLRRVEPVALLRLALPARRAPAEPLVAGGAAAPAGAAAADAADGHVAPVPGAGRGERRRGGEPPHRLALRRQRARRRDGRPRDALAALPVARGAGRDPGGRRDEPCRRRGQPRRSAPCARASAAPAAAPRRRRRRPRPRRLPGAARSGSGSCSTPSPASWPSRSRSSGSACSTWPSSRRPTRSARYSRSTCSARAWAPSPGPRSRAARAARCAPSCSSSARSWRSPPCRSSSWSRCRPTSGASTGSSTTGAATRSFRSGHDADRTSIVGLYVLLPFALFFVPTLLMGLSFPILQRAVHDDPATSGRKVGFLQAANIAGCAAGSLLVGLVALQHLGTPGTLRVMLGTGCRVRPRRLAPLRSRLRAPWRSSSCGSPGRCRGPSGCGAGSTASGRTSSSSSSRRTPRASWP